MTCKLEEEIKYLIYTSTGLLPLSVFDYKNPSLSPCRQNRTLPPDAKSNYSKLHDLTGNWWGCPTPCGSISIPMFTPSPAEHYKMYIRQPLCNNLGIWLFFLMTCTCFSKNARHCPVNVKKDAYKIPNFIVPWNCGVSVMAFCFSLLPNNNNNNNKFSLKIIINSY